MKLHLALLSLSHSHVWAIEKRGNDGRWFGLIDNQKDPKNNNPTLITFRLAIGVEAVGIFGVTCGLRYYSPSKIEESKNKAIDEFKRLNQFHTWPLQLKGERCRASRFWNFFGEQIYMYPLQDPKAEAGGKPLQMDYLFLNSKNEMFAIFKRKHTPGKGKPMETTVTYTSCWDGRKYSTTKKKGDK
ncbi:Bgt-50401 [Blumeria graminis f. sp. tritici]|uniref:Bgt-50401 n=1 Tax=Blumeria graminis f. sp. tritici TaxID=62690 RepID=A0A9X9MP82_BLUGR|nr:Bgt-50401 [Blumeria graminis f. sp. tritici]